MSNANKNEVPPESEPISNGFDWGRLTLALALCAAIIVGGLLLA